jgi:hypothetical protein
LDANPPKLPERSRARNWVIVNLFVCPGLGSWLGGRRVTGALQMLVAFIGFGITLLWFFNLMLVMLREIQGARMEAPDLTQLAIAGFGTVGLAWVWALLTSVVLTREAAARSAPGSPS